jgi:hypothetical protein
MALFGGSMAKHPPHILELARKGAEHRYNEMKTELAELVRAFPHLSDSFDPDELPITFRLKSAAERSERKALRRRAKWNAAQRKAVSERMKRYWAARRAGRKK